MKRAIYLILVALALCGCAKKDVDFVYADNEEAMFFTSSNSLNHVAVPPGCEEVFISYLGRIRKLEIKVKELQRYINCGAHQFCFEKRVDSKYFIRGLFCFTCTKCGLKKESLWCELTEQQKNCFTGLCFGVDPNEVKE